jgi:hypothetical protein
MPFQSLLSRMFISSPGRTKIAFPSVQIHAYEINCLATISFLNAFPVWAIPKGTFILPDFLHLRVYKTCCSAI